MPKAFDIAGGAQDVAPNVLATSVQRRNAGGRAAGLTPNRGRERTPLPSEPETRRDEMPPREPHRVPPLTHGGRLNARPSRSRTSSPRPRRLRQRPRGSLRHGGFGHDYRGRNFYAERSPRTSSDARRCHGRLRVIQRIAEPAVAHAILDRLGVPTTAPTAARARDPTDDKVRDDSSVTMTHDLLDHSSVPGQLLDKYTSRRSLETSWLLAPLGTAISMRSESGAALGRSVVATSMLAS